ncbi:MAG: hypothetical protein WC205_10960 [Opitutaceae bacterium]|jgi:hypothetical protein
MINRVFWVLFSCFFTYVNSASAQILTAAATSTSGEYVFNWSVGRTLDTSAAGTYTWVRVHYASFDGDTTGAPIFIHNGGLLSDGNLTASGSDTYTFPAGQWLRLHTERDRYVLNSAISSNDVWIQVPGVPQTIVVTPTTAALKKGGTLSFTVTGHHTGLVYSLPDVTINPPNWQRVFDQVGIQPLSIYAEAADGYAKSNTVTIMVTVTGYKIVLKLPANPSENMIVYDVTQKGVVIFSTNQLARAAEITRTFEVPDSDVCTVTSYVLGLSKEDEIIVKDQNGRLYLTPQLITPTAIVSDADTVPENTLPTAAVPKTPASVTDDKTVWSKTDANSVDAKDTTVKQGVDKIVSAIDQVNATLKARLHSSGAGGAFDVTGIETRIDTTNDTLVEIRDLLTPDEDAVASAQQSAQAKGAAASSDVAYQQDRASAVGTALTGGAMLVGATTLMGTPMPGDNGYAFMPKLVDTSDNSVLSRISGGSIDVNPFSSAKLASITQGNTGVFLAWIRNFIAWASILGFLKWTLDEVNKSCAQLGIVTPVQLSPSAQIVAQTTVLGNSVGVPFAGALWALQVLAITTALLAAPAVIVTAIYTAGEWSSLFPSATVAKAATSSAGGSALGNIISYSYIILPVVVLVTISINSVFIRVSNIAQTVIVGIGMKLASAI